MTWNLDQRVQETWQGQVCPPVTEPWNHQSASPFSLKLISSMDWDSAGYMETTIRNRNASSLDQKFHFRNSLSWYTHKCIHMDFHVYVFTFLIYTEMSQLCGFIPSNIVGNNKSLETTYMSISRSPLVAQNPKEICPRRHWPTSGSWPHRRLVCQNISGEDRAFAHRTENG